MAKKSELLLFAKILVQPSFSNVFRCFFRFQPSFMTIFYVFLRCNHWNKFFPIIAIVGANDDRQRSFAQVQSALSILLFTTREPSPSKGIITKNLSLIFTVCKVSLHYSPPHNIRCATMHLKSFRIIGKCERKSFHIEIGQRNVPLWKISRTEHSI